MITFRPYEPADLARIDLQPAQSHWRDKTVTPGYAAALVNAHAWTGLDGDRVVGCAGLVPLGDGRAHAWALFGRDVPVRSWPAIVRKVVVVCRESGFRRVETSVADGFGPGCRLATLVGFRVEGMMRAYASDGRDHIMYARIAR